MSLQVQNETCRHSAVIFTIAEPQMEHPSARGSRLIVQRGMLMWSALIGSCSMETLSVRGFEI